MKTKGFFQFEIIINVLVCSFRFIWIHMSSDYGHYNFGIFFSVSTVIRRQNLTSINVRFWRLKTVLKSFLSSTINATDPRGPKCLAMYWRWKRRSGGDGCRCQTCGPKGKLTRDVLMNLRETFGEVSPMYRWIFGDVSGKIRGLIGATSAYS